MREFHAVGHGYTSYWYEWNYVDGPHPSVLAAVFAHVNQIDSDCSAFDRGTKNRFRFSHHSHDCTIEVGPHVDIQQGYAFNGDYWL
jgi:hypothetical protein